MRVDGDGVKVDRHLTWLFGHFVYNQYCWGWQWAGLFMCEWCATGRMLACVLGVMLWNRQSCGNKVRSQFELLSSDLQVIQGKRKRLKARIYFCDVLPWSVGEKDSAA